MIRVFAFLFALFLGTPSFSADGTELLMRRRAMMAQTVAATSPAAILGFITASNSSRPYGYFSGTWTQYTSGQYPSPLVGGQTASSSGLFYAVPGTTKFATIQYTTTEAAGLYRAISDTSGLNYALIATDTNTIMRENATYAPGVSTVYEYFQDDTCIRLTDALTVPSAFAISTDGSQTYSTPTNTGFTGSWSSTAVTYRTYARGSLIFLSQGSSAGGGVLCKVSADGGANWTTCTCPGGVVALEHDDTNGVYIAASETFSAGNWGPTITIYTCATIGGTWTSRQTIAAATTAFGGNVANMRVANGLCFLIVQVGSGTGWSLYKVPVGSFATTNPFTSVHAPGGSQSVAGWMAPKWCSGDSLFRYIAVSNSYSSSDGTTWSLDTGSTTGANQTGIPSKAANLAVR